MKPHSYKVDQDVLLAERAGTNLKQAATYKIVAALPARETEPQYRVKGEHERFERMVEESQIRPVGRVAPAMAPEPKAQPNPRRPIESADKGGRGASSP